MKDSLATSLHLREIYDAGARSNSYRKLYSDRRLVSDLDIVNELDGHSGCVNALAWSKSGNLLASGSDDQHLNIHTYQPEDGSAQFRLSTTVATGHTQNIFSVKFMPHSLDRTLITAAGDGEVRVFDIEYAGAAGTASRASALATEGRRRGRNTVYNGVRYLSDGDTNARVYRSHADRVKRIVTESSPYLFLTCSEDGEVRQFDTRQPSSAYPPPRNSRFGPENPVPPPLISYKRYSLDLNTISCSASQPHYIALGGAHLHALLHDRRMTGRDKLKEMGRPLSPIDQMSAGEQELMAQATQCVRKFAPQGQKRMKRADNGHITAIKISDARPDEMIVSWSGDHIYSFDLVRDSEDADPEGISPLRERKSKEGRDRKRKRKVEGSDASLAKEATASTRQRTENASADPANSALRIRYQNGQSEEIPLPNHINQYTPLTELQRSAQKIAKQTVSIRSKLFSSPEEGSVAQFSEALGICGSTLHDMDEIMTDWRYPMEPEPEQVYLQQTLRRRRESSRRFVQASGTLARVLGGKLRSVSGVNPMIAQFAKIEVRRNDLELPAREHFCYDFLKAILLWLDSGVGQLIEGFTRPSDMPSSSKAASRLPVAEADTTPEALDEDIIPYLLQLASDHRIVDVEANRFETGENRTLFQTEKQAVLAFAAAVRIPFADLSSAMVLAGNNSEERFQAQDRKTAHKYWAQRVARGVLLNAGEGVNFIYVDRAFGGLGRVVREITTEEAQLDLLRDTASDDEGDEEQPLQAVEVVAPNGDVVDGANAEDITAAAQEARREENTSHPTFELDEDDAEEDGDVVLGDVDEEDEDEDTEDDDSDEDDNDDDDGDDDGEDIDSDSSSEPDEEDGVPNLGAPRYIYRTAFERRRLRPRVEPDVPCSKPTRRYRGHCNVRTVKDVNYWGPDDDFVVSGSDDGNFFIWDRKTSELVNVLEGDGEVVNVIQGHPYETMLAVSGIDHTIKIFSPDARARQIARLGQGISAHDASSFSSIAWPMRIGRRTQRHRASNVETTSEPAVPAEQQREIDDDDDFVAPNGLSSRKRMHDAYRIMQSNNMEREGGNQQAAITRALLAHLTERIRRHLTETGENPAIGGTQGQVLDGNCATQ
ncbi:hypothetical protein AC578_3604 [Pseudocercospora eumusae]|uniref:Uncharacterized protein n=1 Tax=Pseudocercospora eumusae TaxID=321146 RepID=A0A139HPN7_9PEZI|nr:hypothetical protein AC578_3604 [Pseudocercospora eumusae]